MDDTKDLIITVKDLPVTFQVKYLGELPAKGLWGIKHTRKPVDFLVSKAKNLKPGTILPLVNLNVTRDGLNFRLRDDPNAPVKDFKVDVISYGVQDLIYTRVFSMIVVMDHDLKNGIPFVCHAFVCDSRQQARQLTYALAAAFQEYGKTVKDNPGQKKKFAIDLRSKEEIAKGSDEETEA